MISADFKEFDAKPPSKHGRGVPSGLLLVLTEVTAYICMVTLIFKHLLCMLTHSSLSFVRYSTHDCVTFLSMLCWRRFLSLAILYRCPGILPAMSPIKACSILSVVSLFGCSSQLSGVWVRIEALLMYICTFFWLFTLCFLSLPVFSSVCQVQYYHQQGVINICWNQIE